MYCTTMPGIIRAVSQLFNRALLCKQTNIWQTSAFCGPDANLCVSSSHALKPILGNFLRIGMDGFKNYCPESKEHCFYIKAEKWPILIIFKLHKAGEKSMNIVSSLEE